MNDNKRKLYDALSKDYDMGTYEQFCSDIADNDKRKKLYDAASKDYDFGDYDSFSNQLGFSKEETPQVETPVEPATPVAPQPIQAELNTANSPADTVKVPAPTEVAKPTVEVETPVQEQEPSPEQQQRRALEASTLEQVAALRSTIDENLNAATQESVQAYRQEEEEARKGGFWKQLAYSLAHDVGHDPASIATRENLRQFKGMGNMELQGRIAALQSAQNSLKDAQRIIDEADHNAQSGTFGKWLEQSFAGGVARGLGQHLFDVRTWDMGMSDLSDNSALLVALNKYDKGEDLTESEQMMLDAKAVELATNAYFGSYVGRGYKAGSVTAESIPFMLEMCINPASGAGKAATSKLTRYALERFGKQAVKSNAKKYVAAKAATRVAADIAGAAAMAATSGSIGVAADAESRMAGLNNGSFTTNEEGYSFFNGYREGEDPATALAKAFGARTIENHSELVGEYFAPVIGVVGKGAAKGLDKVGLRKVNDFIKDVRMSDVGKLVADFENHAHWNGLFGEFAEELVGGVENAIVVGDQTIDANPETGVFNPSQMLDTFLGVSLMGGFLSSAKTAGYVTSKYKAGKDLNNADARGQALFGDESWNEIKDEVTRGIEDNDLTSIDARLNEVETSFHKQRILDYLGAYANKKGADIGSMKRRTEGDIDPVQFEAETSYDNGYELTDPQEMEDAQNMLEYRRQQLKEKTGFEDITLDYILHPENNPDDAPFDWLPDQKQAGIDYINAKATYEGMIQHVKDDIESKVTAAHAAIDANTNVDTKRIQPATMKTEDRKVYVVGGVVRPYEDGTGIDKDASSASVVIKDVNTGALEMVSPADILSLDEEIDPVDEKNAVQEQIRSTVAQEAADKIDGKIMFATGQQYTLPDAEGTPVTYQITPDPVTGKLADYTAGYANAVIVGGPLNQDGTPVIVQIPIAPIQEQHDMESLARLQQYEQGRLVEKIAVAQTEQQSQSAERQYQQEDELSLRNADGSIVRGSIVSEPNEDGQYEVYTEEPLNGKKVNLLTREEIENAIVLYNGQEVQNPVEEVAQETAPQPQAEEKAAEVDNRPAIDRIPVDEAGEPVFEKGQAADTWQALLDMNEGNADEARDTANQMYEQANAELEKALKAKPKAGKTVFEIQQNKAQVKSAVKAAQQKASYWKSIVDFEENQKRIAEEEAKRQKRIRMAKAREILRKEGRFKEENAKLGEPVSFRDYVLRAISTGGVTFKWANDKNNPAIKGLGSHLGFTNQQGEMVRRAWMLNREEGLYPEQAAEDLLQGYAEEMGMQDIDQTGMDTMDAFSEVLDVINSYDSPRRMFEAAQELHGVNDLEAQEQAYYESQLAQETEVEPEETQPAKSREELVSDVTDMLQQSDGDMRILDYVDDSELQQFSDLYNKFMQVNEIYGETSMRLAEAEKSKDKKVAEEAKAEIAAAQKAALDAFNPIMDLYNGILKKYNLSEEEVDDLPSGETTAEAIEQARQEVNVEPTEGQKKAGNYKMGHIKLDGYDISLENPKGSVRKGVDENGKAWESEMKNDYGYLRGTEGVDGDHIDVFLSDTPDQGDVFVVDQVNPKTGEFDEHKVMYGFNSVEEAQAAYLANYEEGWQGLGNITPVSKEEFKKWVDSSHRKTKPFAEYASVKPLQTETPSTDVKESLTTAQEPVAKEVDVEGLFNALNTKGEAKLSDFAKEPETVPEQAETVPETEETVPKKPLGTIRTGKHTKTGEDLWIVTPADRVSKEEFTRLKAEAKKRDGYYSSFKPNNGFIFKTEEDANAFNEENAREVSEPITLNELESVVGASFDSVEGKTEPAKDGKPATKWKYDLYVSKDGNSRITRSDIGDGSSYPVGDARFNVTANNPVELKEILENNGMSDILEEIGGMLDVHIDKWNFRQKANTEGFHGYKIGDKILYKYRDGREEEPGVVKDFEEWGEHLPVIDTGLAPVMYEVAHLDQIRHAESKPETEQEQPKQEEKPVNPSGNKLVTDERYAELRRRMMNKLTGQMNIGIDPEILAIGTEMAVYHIEKGARKFAEFAKAMIQDLSDAIRPYLKAFYNGARDLPEMSELSKEMTPYDEVSSFDVANFDKNTVDALAAAETIVKEEDVAEQVEEAKERIKNTVKSSNSKKKSVSSQGESMGSLFSDVEEETESETTNTDNNELSTGSTSKNGEVGEGKQQEVERPSGTGVVENNHEDSAADQGRSTGLAERAPKQPTVKKNKTNNHVERGESYAPTTPAQRFSANVAAIRKMRELMDADRKATPEDMEILRKFTGWGGIGTYFNNEYSAENRELKSLLGDEEYQAAVMSANSAYYTPVNVIDAMWDAAKNLGFTGGTVLEGSAGIGNILASMPKKMSEASDITAVEIDSVTGNILKLLYPEADVNIKGFEETDIPNNSVDLAITNVPFVTGLHVYDKVEKDLSRKFGDIHDFCIAKNVRKLKEGGIGIFITSKGTLDKSKALRNWVVNEGDADFIGAFRLNNTTFIGTSVTSDIIIIRKRVNGNVSPNAIDVSGTTVTRRDTYSPMRYGEKDQPVAMEYNSYFVEHPEFMAGEMKFAFENGETFRPTSSSLYPKEGTDQDKALAKWVKTLRNDAEKAQTTQEQSPATEQESTDNVKEGQLIVNSKGEICLSQRGKAVPIGVNSNKVKGQSKATVVKDYDAIKDALKEVLDYQVANESDEGLKPLLKKLNDVYDSFVKKYGQLNKNVAISFLRNDVDFATIAAIEDFNETETIDGKRKIETEKTDVFSRRMVGYKTEPTPKTSKEGVIVSMNKFGHIDLEYIASKIGLPVEDVRKEIIESKLGYEDPQTGRIEVSYEYLSGNVREKLEYARSQNKDGRYDSNIKALEKVIPYDIPAHLIEFSLGSDWLDKQLYIDFAREKYGLTDEFKIANIGGVWQVVGYGYFDQNNEKNRSAGVTSETVGKTAYGHELMICAMNNTPYTFSKTVKDRYTGETTTITDKNASQVATGRMAEIKDEFRDWCRDKMMNDTSLAEKVQKVYNDLFNAIVPKEVGEEFLPDHFEGSNIDINLYAHQKKAVIRGTTEPLMLAHEVGSGKTFTLISTAMEMRRLGTAKKPMIVAQNATVGQFVSEAKKLYPNAKVLSLTEKDRSQEGRLAFYAKIKYNDWDLIIIPQSTFDLIPDSEERQQMFVQEKIDEKMYVLEQARAANADSNAIRRLEKELKDLETEYNTGVTVKSGKKDAKKEAEAKSNAAAKAKKQLDRKIDDVANFDDMGIDALLIDEAHEYKHLGFSTSIKRGVKGVDPSYSKKSAGVYLKTRAVFDKSGWKNVVFATGTPISNTAAEIWTFMKYLMPADVMKQNHIYYFDDFVRNFGKIAQSLEFATNGKFKENTRFGAYVNVPELVRIWSSVCDTVLTKDAEAASGTKLTDKLPAMEGGKAEDIFLPQSPSLIGIMRAVRKTLEEYEKLSGKEKKEQSHIPLTMYGIAKRAAIDPRLVDADAVDEPLSKTNRAVEEILKDLEATKAYKGTCAVFCDNYRRLEYDETGKKKEAFNLFQEIKRKLVEAGVPENQIVVMESGMSIEKKEKIFAQVNDGSIRVILGSTRTLGTGVNIQQRLHLLIHMDAPDRPMDYTQRNGRILRQGNLHKGWGKTVKVLRFGVEDSLDVTSYQRLKTKSSFIDSIMDGKPLLANGMEGRVLEEEEEGLFDNPVAVLSGSQFALKKSQAERELRKYQGKLKQYQQDQIYIERQLKDNKNRIANNERFIKDYEASIALAKETFKDGKVKVVAVVGVPCRTEEEINTAIREKITKPLNAVKERARNSWGWNTTDYEYPLSFDGITVKVKVSVGRKEGMYVNGQMQKPSSFTVYSYSCSQLLNDIERSIPSTEGVKGIIDEFRTNLATGIYQQNAVNRLSANIERMTSDNELMLQRRGVPFAEQDKLDEAKARVDEYTKLMKEEMAEKEKKYADAQAVETNVDLSAIDIDDEDSDEDTNRYRSAAPSDVFTAEYPFKELRRQWIEDGEIYNAAETNDILQQLLEDFPDFEPAFARFIEMNEKNRDVFWETGGRDVEFEEEQLQDTFNAALDEEILNAVNPDFDNAERFRIREKEAPKETGIGYKVFKLKNGRLYPPMVDNPGGADTPVFLWLDADAAPVAAQSKTGRKKVKSSGSGTLAYRPGWHLGKIPYALQFNRGEKVDNPLGIRNLGGGLIKVGKYFPKDFVWAEVEYAADNNYQKEAMSYGYNENGKFQHSLAGLPEIPVDGYYEYRTNANPATDPWIITGAMRVKKILKPSEVDELVKAAGREPQLRQPGAFTDAQIDKLNESLSTLSEDNAESKEKTALSLAKALGVNVNVIADREEITDSIRSRQRRKRNSKGWYDTLTQEIVVVLQNNVNNADVEATILHEIVGHKGMRELVGEENYNDFLEKVYRAADVELRKRITELAARKGWDFNLATEEYIASLAESGFKERQERSLLEKIRDLFVDMLHRAKIALGYNINDNDLRYMLWRSYKGRIKSALDLAEDINARMEMQVGDYAVSNKNTNFVDNERRGNQTNDNDRSQRENGTGVAENNARRLGAKHTLGDTGVFEEELAAQRSRYSETDGSNFIQGQIGESLIDIAKRTGRFISWEEAVSSGTKLNGNTKESICFVSDDLQKITKLKDPYAARATKGNSPFDIIEELILHNELFPETAYRLVGITQDRLGDMRFVLEQDFVKYESFADENDIADYLQKLGLKDEGRFIFGDERCAVLDAYGENVLVDENGKLRFIDPIIRIKQSPDDNLRYRSGEARDIYETAERRVNDEGRKTSTANLLHRLHEAYQDSMLALKELQKAISKETGNPVEDNENAYMAENAMSSQNKAQADIYRQRFYTPLLDSIRDLMKKGARYNDIVSYAICKHGLERNEYMARRKANEDMADKWKDFNEKYSGVGPETTDNNLLTAMESERAKLEEQEEKLFAKYSKMDFSGLKGITGDEDNFTDIAEMIVADFEKLYDTKPLWEKVNKATKETLYKNYASGLMSRDTYNKVRGMFDYYIPLRGWDSDVAANEYDYLLSSKPLFSQTLKTMQGRTSVADDPFATIGHMAESAIALGNRNLMKQKFLNFVLNNPTSLATVSKQWYVLDTATQEWEPRNPYIPEDASPDQVTDIIEQFEKDMAVLESQGFAKTKRSGLNLSKHVTVYEGQEHVVRVKRNGVEYAIYINGNPRAAQALNGLTNPNASKSNLLQIAQAVKNFMARMFTSQNPAFIITNLSRDAIWSGTAVAVKENAKYNEQYQKNILNALAKGKLVSLVSKFNNGKLDDTVPIERYFSEFIKNGGETGFTQLNTVEDFKREMRRFVKDIERGGTPVTTKVWRSIWDGVEFMNRCAEDTTRFAVYMTSRQMGRTVARSVFDAKEITVNFNKKGSGGYLSQFMNFAYIFFNATIQSIANITKLTKENPGKMSAAVGLYTAAGIITPLLAVSMGLAFGGGDDDDEESYWDLPEWVRRNNLVFRIPWSSNGYITIPLPHELRPFYGLGEIAFSCYMGKEKVEDGLVKGAEGFTSMIPLDFTGNAGNTAVNFTPTIAQPFAQLIANVDFFGTPIYKRNDYNKLDPEWTKAYKGTNAWIVNGTKWLNDVTGGNNVKKGAIDLNPAVIEHLYESYLGGVGKTINRAAKTVSMIWDDEMREWRNVPVASSFIQTANERTSGSQLNREYFNYKDEHDKVEHELAGYKKQLRMGAMEYADVINEFMESEEFQRYRKLHGYVEAVSKMNSALKYSDETRREELEESIKELKRTLVEELHKEEDSNK